jgi:hypothetical protein
MREGVAMQSGSRNNCSRSSQKAAEQFVPIFPGTACRKLSMVHTVSTRCCTTTYRSPRTKSTIVPVNSRFSLLSIAQACRNQQYFYVDTQTFFLYMWTPLPRKLSFYTIKQRTAKINSGVRVYRPRNSLTGIPISRWLGHWCVLPSVPLPCSDDCYY